MLKILLLGGFFVEQDNQPITKFRSAKSRALLAYLATHLDQAHSRNMLATLLWGDFSESVAKTNLRVELSHLKKQLNADPALEITRQTVCLNSDLVTVDTAVFTETIRVFKRRSAEAQALHVGDMESGLALYRGEFLAGFHLADTPEFDDWQRATQEKLHAQVMQALALLQQRYAEQGAWTAVAQTARRQLEIVPWLETPHRGLIQALAAQGLQQEALAQYAKCCDLLQAELGSAPSPETEELARRLENGRFSSSARKHNLATPRKTFVGRESEIANLQQLVQTERLVTLLGIGGVGKSSLAQVVAHKALPDFANGVWFVPLASIDPHDGAAERIALAIAGAIHYPLTDMQAPVADLTAHLATKQMLLVLDNCEHVLAAVEVVLHSLLDTTSTHILATSRLSFRMGERPFPLHSLSQAEAVALFVDRAQRLFPNFAQTDETVRADVGQLCQQIGGLPLGIELAASWVEHFSVAEIAQSLAELEIEPRQAETFVGRHHSLHNVLTYSWQLLSLQQQQILARLSVFRGGFDRSAVTAVAQSSLSELSLLIAHSLVQRTAAGRYDLHPVVQEFAHEKLSCGQKEQLQQRYSHHYLTSLLNIERSQRTDQLQIDYENIIHGWQVAIQTGDAALIQPITTQFCEFIRQCGLLTEGYALFQLAISHFENDSSQNELVAQLLDQQWNFSRALHGLKTASALQIRLLTLTNNLELQVKTHIELANVYAEDGQWEKADAHFDQAELLAQQSPDLHIYINAVEGRIHINTLSFRGDFAKSIVRLQEMLALLETIAEKETRTEDLRFGLLNSLNIAAMRYGDYSLAINTAKRDIEWVSQMGNRQYMIWVLLDVALTQQFAGMYTEAIAHNLQALTIAEEIGAADDIGLLKANLCLTMRQSGHLNDGLAYGLAAIEALQALELRRMEGQARNRVGHILLALAQWDEAYQAYEQALAVWATMQHPNRFEAVAGRAVAALALGEADEAAQLVDEVLAFVGAEGVMGIVEPIFLYLNLERVLTGLGRYDEACSVLQQAQAWVQMIAARISDEAIREVFLNRPDHEELQGRTAVLS